MVAEGFNPRHQAGLPSAATPWLNRQNLRNAVLVERYRSSAGLALLSGDRQIPDSRRDLTIPAERLN